MHVNVATDSNHITLNSGIQLLNNIFLYCTGFGLVLGTGRYDWEGKNVIKNISDCIWPTTININKLKNVCFLVGVVVFEEFIY